ncbi:unnamed protein product [Caenorhabditis auriculariae]|uniref:BHLH domain-containing protein n=1 Tax=Caenorhabditis auriculariae TaxID=2777116 RepID=A0A8S1GXE9_9PELO|nr:unnamed protein product [Caenorhabditis auriculariae]
MTGFSQIKWYKSVDAPPHRCSQRVNANERERQRMHRINNGFDRLRQLLPESGWSTKKPTKVETLKRAIFYIAELKMTLNPGETCRSEEGNDENGYQQAVWTPPIFSNL